MKNLVPRDVKGWAPLQGEAGPPDLRRVLAVPEPAAPLQGRAAGRVDRGVVVRRGGHVRLLQCYKSLERQSLAGAPRTIWSWVPGTTASRSGARGRAWARGNGPVPPPTSSTRRSSNPSSTTTCRARPAPGLSQGVGLRGGRSRGLARIRRLASVRGPDRLPSSFKDRETGRRAIRERAAFDEFISDRREASTYMTSIAISHTVEYWWTIGASPPPGPMSWSFESEPLGEA